MSEDLNNVRELVARLRGCAAYMSDHHGMLLDDDQTDLIVSDSTKAADALTAYASIMETLLKLEQPRDTEKSA